MTTTIAKSNPCVTLINVFTVLPEKQKALVELLVRATEETMQHLPGFISANIHSSLDGTKVTNYAQWRSAADFEGMLKNPVAIPHMKASAALAIKFEPTLYQVADVFSLDGIPA